MYPPLPQEFSRVRNISQNQNTLEINRQIVHPPRNRSFQSPRVHFDIPQSPTPTSSENPNSTLPETPPLLTQRSPSTIPSDYLGSTPTSEQIREKPFNPPIPQHDYHMILLHLYPDDCKNKLLRLNITRNKNTDRKLVIVQVFADTVHQAQLERYQGQIKLDEKNHTRRKQPIRKSKSIPKTK